MRFCTPSLLILGAFVLGGIVFKSTTPSTCGPILQNDNIFVLTGDARRIPFAMRILRQNPTVELYVIGAGANTAFIDATRVTVEATSKSTYQNAIAIGAIVRNKNLSRAVIITTEDHMNRAMHLVRNELPETEIVACPVRLIGTPPAKRLQRWTTEYIKYIVTHLGIREG